MKFLVKYLIRPLLESGDLIVLASHTSAPAEKNCAFRQINVNDKTACFSASSHCEQFLAVS